MLNVTFVKKKLEDGSWCAKCNDVSTRLEKDGLLSMTNNIAIADVTQADSEGVKLAQQHHMDRAPFFIVENTETKETEVFDIYFKFKRFIQRSTKVAA